MRSIKFPIAPTTIKVDPTVISVIDLFFIDHQISIPITAKEAITTRDIGIGMLKIIPMFLWRKKDNKEKESGAPSLKCVKANLLKKMSAITTVVDKTKFSQKTLRRFCKTILLG